MPRSSSRRQPMETTNGGELRPPQPRAGAPATHVDPAVPTKLQWGPQLMATTGRAPAGAAQRSPNLCTEQVAVCATKSWGNCSQHLAQWWGHHRCPNRSNCCHHPKRQLHFLTVVLEGPRVPLPARLRSHPQWPLEKLCPQKTARCG